MATEYAQCPVCLDDGPHLVLSDVGSGEELECDACGHLFPSPFEEDD